VVVVVVEGALVVLVVEVVVVVSCVVVVVVNASFVVLVVEDVLDADGKPLWEHHVSSRLARNVLTARVLRAFCMYAVARGIKTFCT